MQQATNKMRKNKNLYSGKQVGMFVKIQLSLAHSYNNFHTTEEISHNTHVWATTVELNKGILKLTSSSFILAVASRA